MLVNLKRVDLSKNQFSFVEDLRPLADNAKNIEVLKIDCNPFVHNLNYLYEIALVFRSLSIIQSEYEI